MVRLGAVQPEARNFSKRSRSGVCLRRGGLRIFLLCFLFGVAFPTRLASLPNAVAAILREELPALREVRQGFISGRYTETIRACEKAIANEESEEEWRILLAQSLLATGRNPEALLAVQKALTRFPWSISLRITGYHVYRNNGARDNAQELLEEINQLAGRRTSGNRDTASVVALGRAALLLRADPRRVLENFFDRVKKADPENREVHLASGEVALEKNDFDLAAKTFANALKKFPDDPDFLFGLARAYEPSDRPQMLRSAEAALTHNTNHVPSMLLLVDHLVDAEEYDAAEKILRRALTVNPWDSSAWSYRAVLAHLHNDSGGEEKARTSALRFWKDNPEVDSLIGKKLAQKYRFAEAAGYQRRALSNDPKHLPARIELAQDLLRLGAEEEGWTLAEAVHDADAYDVTAYNLVTLKGSLAKYQALTNADFLVRMAPHEAEIYGSDVLDLLQRAKTNLCAKYGLVLEHPTTVEIFEKQKDFAVRTFGMPGNPGYLGVCFGSVVTANSPASQAPHPANWQAVLWHEFCHVVTLQLTRNKMPRWLSEGISVYEERQANPAWGQTMTPRFREMVLGPEFTPVSELSAAFLTAKSNAQMQFAYYESSLVVEFLVERHGQETLKKILVDLGKGEEINKALAAHTKGMAEFEKDFTAFARERARKLGPELDWEKPKRLAAINEEWIAEHPTNFYALQRKAIDFIRNKKWQEAKAPLEILIKAYPEQKDANNAYSLLAQVHRQLQETNAERDVLQKLSSFDADDWESFLRSCELAAAREDWSEVLASGERLLAVNPLLPQSHRFLAQGREALQQNRGAIRNYEALLVLDPPDPADIHFRLGNLLHHENDPRAKKHVLQALEEAPRFRKAHELLLELTALPAAATNPGETSLPTAKGTP